MFKKTIRITDEDTNESYLVEEVGDDDVLGAPEEEVKAPVEEPKAEDVKLTDDEIASIKELLAMMPDIKALLAKKEEPACEDEKPSAEEVLGLDSEEEVVEACEDEKPVEPIKAGDSIAKLVGKNERTLADSNIVDHSEEVNEAWAKRYARK